MKGFLIHLHSKFAVLLFLIGPITDTIGMTKYLTNQETNAQLILQLSRMTLPDRIEVSPYNKFRSNYFRISVCSFRHSQKLETCDMLLGDDRYQYLRPKQFRPELSCKRFEFQVASSKSSTKGFKCPTPERVVLSVLLKPVSLSFTTTVAYFLSSASETNSITLYYRYPGLHTKIKPDMTVLNFPMNHLRMMIKGERKKPYERIRNLDRIVYHEITPQRIYEWSTKTVRNPPVAENEVLYFERNVKRNTRIYQKFQNALHLTHLCSYTSLQLANVCSQMLENDASLFEFRNDFETTNLCHRRSVYLLHSLYGLPRSSLHLVQCHLTGSVNRNSYFISTSAVKGKILLHVQYNPHEEILPEGYAPIELKDLHLLRT